MLLNTFSIKPHFFTALPPLSNYFSALQVQFPDGKRTLCLIPARFHKKLWIKRGNYLIIENVEETDAAVTGQVVQVLFTDHVKQLKKIEGIWPIEFAESNSINTKSSPANAGSATSAAEELAQLSIHGAAEGKGKNRFGGENTQPVGEAAAPLATENKVAGSKESYSSSDDDLPPIIKIQNRRVVDYQVSESESDDEEKERR